MKEAVGSEPYLTGFIFCSGFRCTWDIMIWFVESLLTPITRAPSIREPTTPSYEINKNHKKKNVIAILSIYMRLFKEAQKHTAYRPEPQILNAEHFGCRQTQWSCL